jgi:hypothetical protein
MELATVDRGRGALVDFGGSIAKPIAHLIVQKTIAVSTTHFVGQLANAQPIIPATHNKPNAIQSRIAMSTTAPTKLDMIEIIVNPNKNPLTPLLHTATAVKTYGAPMRNANSPYSFLSILLMVEG